MQKQGDVFVSSSIARYKPYGGYLTQPSATALDRAYTGHDRTAADDGLGLVYMNARYYDSSLGRFISADTLVPEPGNPQAFNRYSYALGNPVGLVDPSGHCSGSYDTTTGQATEDQSCWDQYYDFVRRLQNGHYYNYLDIIGSGEDYQYRRDYDIVWALHDNEGLAWSDLLPHTFSLGTQVRGDRVCDRLLTCNTGYQMMTYEGQEILMDGDGLYKLWVEGRRPLYATTANPDTVAFISAVDRASDASTKWGIEIAKGWGSVGAAVGCTAITAGTFLWACGLGAVALWGQSQLAASQAQSKYYTEIDTARSLFRNLQVDGGSSVVTR